MSELFSGKKYSVIYADPPWEYKESGSITHARGLAKQHYPIMTDEELSELRISDLAAEQSALFMWATAPCLPQALKLIKAWGFKYKTVAFTWIKQCKRSDKLFTGMGFYTRANAEFCLLATRGGRPFRGFRGRCIPSLYRTSRSTAKSQRKRESASSSSSGTCRASSSLRASA